MDKKGLIQGYVVLRRNGEIIYDDYNTITSAGREFILSSIISNALLNLPNNDEMTGTTEFITVKSEGGVTEITENYKLSGIGFGYGTGDTGEPSLKLQSDYVFPLSDSEHVTSLTIDFESCFLKYSLQVNATDTMNITVSELGLYITPVSETDIPTAILGNKGKLFSRISFDPIPMVPSTVLTLDYYIYF